METIIEGGCQMGTNQAAQGIERKNPLYMVIATLICAAFVISGLVFVIRMMRLSVAENSSYLINSAGERRETISRQIQGDLQTLRGLSTCLAELDDLQSDQITRVLQEINMENRFIRMGVANLSGELLLFAINGDTYQLNVAEEPFFLQALLGEETVSGTRLDSQREGVYINYFAVPVWNEEEVSGVLVAVHETYVLRSILDQPLMNGEGASSIVNKNGQMVVRTLDEGFQRVLTLDDLQWESQQERDKAYAALNRDEVTTFQCQVEGVTMLGTLLPVRINDWYVLSTIPVEALQGRYSQTAAGMTILIVAAGALFVALIYMQRRTMIRSQKKLYDLAYRDELIGCPNFQKFQLDAPGRVKHGDWVVWYCDLKNFKYYNDVFGYQKGDELLRRVALLIEENMQPEELFCRVSADNFVGLRVDRGQEEMEQWFSAMAETLRREEQKRSNQMNVELSMGVYRVDGAEDSLTINDMVDRANMTQKSIKGLPGSRMTLYTPQLRERSLLATSLSAEGESAIWSGQFQVYFQPKVGIQQGDTVVGAEALVRWQHPQRGIIPPNVFIPVFEETGLVVDLDRYMFWQVCRWYSNYLKTGRPLLNISINVSRLGIFRKDFLEYYTSVKEEHGIPDGVLELEFTETVVLDDDQAFQELVNTLRQRGFVCSLDDFGAGYSSLNMLKNLPINVLKLDVLFFRKSQDAQRDHIVVSNIIHMARQLNINTTAEGVESPELVEFLRGVGCDMVQGYVFSKPMPMADFDALLASAGEGELPSLVPTKAG